AHHFLDRAREGDAEHLADRAAAVDQTVGGGGAFFGSEIDRGRAGDQRIGNENEEANDEHANRHRHAGERQEWKADHEYGENKAAKDADWNSFGMENFVGDDPAGQRSDGASQVEHAAEDAGIGSVGAETFGDVNRGPEKQKVACGLDEEING